MFVTSDLSILLVTGVTKISANRITSRLPYSGSPSSPEWLRETSLQPSRDGMRHFEPDRELYERFASPEQKAAAGTTNFLLLPAASNEGLLSETYSKPLLVLMGMVALLLLIGCLNLANLQRTRMLRRSHEFAIRSALGSSRQRLVQQLVAEMIALGACGGFLSLGIAHVLGSTLVRLSSDRPIHVNLRFGLDVHVFCLISLLIDWPCFRCFRRENYCLLTPYR